MCGRNGKEGEWESEQNSSTDSHREETVLHTSKDEEKYCIPEREHSHTQKEREGGGKGRNEDARYQMVMVMEPVCFRGRAWAKRTRGISAKDDLCLNFSLLF